MESDLGKNKNPAQPAGIIFYFDSYGGGGAAAAPEAPLSEGGPGGASAGPSVGHDMSSLARGYLIQCTLALRSVKAHDKLEACRAARRRHGGIMINCYISKTHF